MARLGTAQPGTARHGKDKRGGTPSSQTGWSSPHGGNSRVAGNSGNGRVGDYPILTIGQSVTIHGYTITVESTAPNATVAITRDTQRLIGVHNGAPISEFSSTKMKCGGPTSKNAEFASETTAKTRVRAGGQLALIGGIGEIPLDGPCVVDPQTELARAAGHVAPGFRQPAPTCPADPGSL